MGMARVFGVCAALLFASSVSAANIIDVGPSDYRNFGPNGSHTSSGIRSSTGQTVRIPPGSGSLTVTRNAVIPYSGVANGLRNFVRVSPQSVAASAAITGMFLAFDWVWDSAEQSWGKYEFECPVGSICAIDGNQNVLQMCARHPGALTSVGEVKTVTASTSFSAGGRTWPAGTTVSVTVVPGAESDSNPYTVNNCVQRYPEGAWPQQDGRFPALIATPIEEPGVPEQVFLRLMHLTGPRPKASCRRFLRQLWRRGRVMPSVDRVHRCLDTPIAQ